MNTRAAITLGLSALVMGGATVGCTQQGDIASASANAQSRAAQQAQANAVKAGKALAKGKTDLAITLAEAAVGLDPDVASYRVLLGQAYLKAGRFGSARQAFADAVTLEPGNGKAALNLALAQIGQGQWEDARATVADHSTTISTSDRGLALALAGDPSGAVELLANGVRGPEADAKMRQNLALSLALAGRWQEAKTVVSIDLSPAEVDQRIMAWAAFAKPKSASDQIASLLGVVPVEDPGQPVALALNRAPASAPAMAAIVPEAAPVPASVEAPVAVAAAQTNLVPAELGGAIRYNLRQEVIQDVPVRSPLKVAYKTGIARVAGRPAAARKAIPRAPAAGTYFVQLGAYDSVDVARDAWARATRRYAGFAAHTPSGMDFKAKTGSFYRLSVGGFAKTDAVAMCSSYRARGGTCFVRSGEGDQIARWAQAPRLASR